MKIRTDYVTNSSSSSFILAFGSEEYNNYNSFKEYCIFLDYKEFFVLIEQLKMNPENMSKDKALDLLYNVYKVKYQDDLLKSYLSESDYHNFTKRSEYLCSEEFKNNIRQIIESDEEYIKKKKQIEDSIITITGMIWDTDGGILEWAIRNDFIENNFWNYHILTQHIG